MFFLVLSHLDICCTWKHSQSFFKQMSHLIQKEKNVLCFSNLRKGELRKFDQNIIITLWSFFPFFFLVHFQSIYLLINPNPSIETFLSNEIPYSLPTLSLSSHFICSFSTSHNSWMCFKVFLWHYLLLTDHLSCAQIWYNPVNAVWNATAILDWKTRLTRSSVSLSS